MDGKEKVPLDVKYAAYARTLKHRFSKYRKKKTFETTVYFKNVAQEEEKTPQS